MQDSQSAGWTGIAAAALTQDPSGHLGPGTVAVHMIAVKEERTEGKCLDNIAAAAAVAVVVVVADVAAAAAGSAAAGGTEAETGKERREVACAVGGESEVCYHYHSHDCS